MTNGKLIKVLKVLFVIHVSVSIFMIFFGVHISSKITRLYLRHIVPGPFFSERNIVGSNHLTISWLETNAWTKPINPAVDSFNKYLSSYNTYYFYKSRFQRTLTDAVIYRLTRKKQSDILRTREWKMLRQYLKDNIVPAKSDSIQVRIYLHYYANKDTVLFAAKLPNI